jgi:hypothetical protein
MWMMLSLNRNPIFNWYYYYYLFHISSVLAMAQVKVTQTLFVIVFFTRSTDDIDMLIWTPAAVTSQYEIISGLVPFFHIVIWDTNNMNTMSCSYWIVLHSLVKLTNNFYYFVLSVLYSTIERIWMQSYNYTTCIRA